MAEVALIFFALAAIILLGFLTSRIFQATRFPDVPLLLSIGLLMGPLNRAAPEGLASRFLEEKLDIDALRELTPFISSLALVIILFDSGLKLDFGQFGRSIRPAFLHTFPLFFLTVTSIALIGNLVLGMPPLVAVVLGVALSNVGQTVSAAIIREVPMEAETRSIYFIEMALYDLLSIPILTSLLQLASETAGGVTAQLVVQSLARVLIVSIFLGVAGGIVWIWVLLKLQEYPYSYMVTLATLLLVYSVNTFLGGSGPVSVLVFGLILGNRKSVQKLFQKRPVEIAEGQKVQSFHDEITFFVRAFFFIYLGFTFTTSLRGGDEGGPANLAGEGGAYLFLLAVGLIFLAILGTRYLVVRLMAGTKHPDRRRLFLVYGRGLGTAVLATFPFTVMDYKPALIVRDVDTGSILNYGGSEYTALFYPWEPVFINCALLIILLTVAGSGYTVFLMERRAAAAAAAEKGSSGTGRRATKD